MNTDLSGARVLVVGASSGIGRSIAEVAARHGARLAVAARRKDLLEEVALATGGTPIQVDISDPAACVRCVDEAVSALGGLDCVVIASAVMPVARIKEFDPQDWAHTFAVNVTGPSLVLRAVADQLGDRGLAVVISSEGVGQPRAGLAAYSASKAALDETVASWRVEHPELRVLRCVVGPTYTKGLIDGLPAASRDAWIMEWAERGQIPALVATPEDVAAQVVSGMVALRAATTAFVDVLRIIPRPTAGTHQVSRPAG